MDSPAVTDISQQPSGVNQPTSGTYGEGAALDRLQAALPGQDPGTPAATSPTPQSGQPGPPPMPPGQGGGTAGGPPAALFDPSNNPSTPVSTPLQPGPQALPTDGAALRLLAWQHLADDPNTSDETRELAQRVVLKLTRAARA